MGLCISPERSRHAQTLLRGLERQRQWIGGPIHDLYQIRCCPRLLLPPLPQLTVQSPRVPTALKDVQVAPLKVINMDVGAKHAIGYYLAENGSCNLTVLLTDYLSTTDGTAPSASRVSVNVCGGHFGEGRYDRRHDHVVRLLDGCQHHDGPRPSRASPSRRTSRRQ